MKKILLSISALLLMLVLVSCQENNDEKNNEDKTKENIEILVNDWKEFAIIDENYDFEAYYCSGLNYNESKTKELFLYNAKDKKIKCFDFEYWFMINPYAEYYRDYSVNFFVTQNKLYKELYFNYDYNSRTSKKCVINIDYINSELELWDNIISNLINPTDIGRLEFYSFTENQNYIEYTGIFDRGENGNYDIINFERKQDKIILYSSEVRGYIEIRKQKTFGEVDFEIPESMFTEYDSLKNKIW